MASQKATQHFDIFYRKLNYFIKACLSAIIAIALKNLMREVTNVPNIYRKNKMEAVRLCRAFS